MNTAQFNKLQQALKLLNEANCLVQEALGASEQCYALHNAIENVDDEICNILRDADEVGVTA